MIGLCILLAGLATLFAMVIRLIEPGFALAFLAYAALFTGMLLALAGIVQHVGTRR
jgi:hypothetical protein